MDWNAIQLLCGSGCSGGCLHWDWRTVMNAVISTCQWCKDKRRVQMKHLRIILHFWKEIGKYTLIFYYLFTLRRRIHLRSFLVVRRAGLLLSQQDFEWRWSVPLFQCLIVLEFSFILFDLCLLITFFNFVMNYVPIVTFWIFTYHKIWIFSIMFCFIWSYWIIYFLACL